jgi:phosphotransferase system IIB component
MMEVMKHKISHSTGKYLTLVSHLKQRGRAIEEYYDDLQKLWQEIDFRCPNPMECVKDIEAFNTYIRKNRVSVFLDGLDDRLDHVRAEVLKINPFPTIEQAYGHVRRENIRQEVMIKGDGGYQNSMAMVSKGYKSTKVRLTLNKNNSVDKSKLKYSHCGGTRHVKEQCFQIVGYPKWYMERKKISSKCQREKQHLQQPT